MKGIILEVQKNNITILNHDGEFITLKNYDRSYAVGEIYEYRKESYFQSKQWIALAASLLLFITSGLGFASYYIPQGYINIDVNPSIEVSYNLYERVINAAGVNSDGTLILNQLMSLKNKKVENAVKLILDEIETMGYITDSDNKLALITVNGRDKGNKILTSIMNSFEADVITYDVAITDGEKRNREQHQNLPEEIDVTPGEFNLIEKIQRQREEKNSVEDKTEEVGKSGEVINQANQKGSEEIQKQSEKTVEELIQEIEKNSEEQVVFEIKGMKQGEEKDNEKTSDSKDSGGKNNDSGKGK